LNRILPESLKGDVMPTNMMVDIDLEYLHYITKTLATLPYDCQEEPLYIIYHINRLTSIHGDSLKQQMFALLVSLSKGGHMFQDFDLAFYLGRNDVSRKHKVSRGKKEEKPKKVKLRKFKTGGDMSTNPSRNIDEMEASDSSITSSANISGASDTESSQASIFPIEEDNPYIEGFSASGMTSKELLLKLQYKSSLATMFSLLLRLKSFLKKVYMLSNERCTDYIPSMANKSTSADTPLKNMVKNQDFPTFEFPLELLLTNHDYQESTDLNCNGKALFQLHCERFLEYDACLKRDPIDFNFERRRTSTKRKRKSNKSAEEMSGDTSDDNVLESRKGERSNPMHPPKPKQKK